MKSSSKSTKLAKHEIGWWKAHHRKQWEKVLSEMSQLYHLQFGISLSEAKKCVQFRLRAAKEHDLAEKFEDKGSMKRANVHWEKAEKWLVKHFSLLENNRKHIKARA